MMTFEQCDSLVGRLVPELLSDTGLSLVGMYQSGRSIAHVELRDAFEFRIGLLMPWSRIVKRVEIVAMDCVDDPTLMQAVAAGVQRARADLAAELRSIADKVSP